jgi:hypothetical protein
MVIDPNSFNLAEACWTQAAYNIKSYLEKIADKVVLLRFLAI